MVQLLIMWLQCCAGELLAVFRCHRLFTSSFDCHCNISASCTQPSCHQLLLQSTALVMISHSFHLPILQVEIFVKHDVAVATYYYRRLDFPMAILAYFFSRHHIVSKQRHYHVRQTICSTWFGVRVCLLVVWCKNFQPPHYRPPKFKIFHCKMQFFVKITHLL